MARTRSRKPATLARTSAQWLARRVGHVLISEQELELVTERKNREDALTPKEEDQLRVKLLSARGVDVVLDVGANIGQYAIRTRRAGFEGRIVSFEPLGATFAELSAAAESDPAWECRRHALGAQDGSAEINVSRNTYSSSLLEIEKRHLDTDPGSAYVAEEQITVSRLDSIWDQIVRPAERAFLKLDVQGFELEALRGATESLPKLDGVQTELSLVPLYEGAPGYRELIDHLEERGFRLAGIEAELTDPVSGELLQANGIFVRA